MKRADGVADSHAATTRARSEHAIVIATGTGIKTLFALA